MHDLHLNMSRQRVSGHSKLIVQGEQKQVLRTAFGANETLCCSFRVENQRRPHMDRVPDCRSNGTPYGPSVTHPSRHHSLTDLHAGFQLDFASFLSRLLDMPKDSIVPAI